MTTVSQLQRRFERSVPDNIQRALLTAVYTAYKAASDDVLSQFEPPERPAMLGYVRRSKLEMNLRGLADRFPGVSAEVGRAEGTSWRHTAISVGGVRITASTVSGPDQLPKPADFRIGYAMQTELFADNAPTEETTIYALLAHGPSSDDRSLPGFARLAVPSMDCGNYVMSIDLMRRFPDVVARFVGEPVIAEPGSDLRLKAVPAAKTKVEET